MNTTIDYISIINDTGKIEADYSCLERESVDEIELYVTADSIETEHFKLGKYSTHFSGTLSETDISRIASVTPSAKRNVVVMLKVIYLDGSISYKAYDSVFEFENAAPDIQYTYELTPHPAKYEGIHISGDVAEFTINCTAKYGASIVKQSKESFILNEGTNAIILFAVDSRGLASSKTIIIEAEEYHIPRIEYKNAYRCNSSGEKSISGNYLAIMGFLNYSSVNSLNSCNVYYRYREFNGEYSEWVITELDSVLPLNLDANKGYDVQLKVEDDFEMRIYTFIIPTNVILYQIP